MTNVGTVPVGAVVHSWHESVRSDGKGPRKRDEGRLRRAECLDDRFRLATADAYGLSPSLCCSRRRCAALDGTQELVKDSIRVLRRKCESFMAEIEAYEAKVGLDEVMP